MVRWYELQKVLFERLNDPSYGSKDFRKFWNSVKNKKYWIVEKKYKKVNFDDEIPLIGWSWCINWFEVESYKDCLMETE